MLQSALRLRRSVENDSRALHIFRIVDILAPKSRFLADPTNCLISQLSRNWHSLLEQRLITIDHSIQFKRAATFNDSQMDFIRYLKCSLQWCCFLCRRTTCRGLRRTMSLSCSKRSIRLIRILKYRPRDRQGLNGLLKKGFL